MQLTKTISWIVALWTLPFIHAQSDFSDGGEILVQTSLWTTHFGSDPDHNDNQDLINLEWYPAPEQQPPKLKMQDPDSWKSDIRWLVGGAHFRNSFSQRSTYLYAGGRYQFPVTDNLSGFVKLTGGLLHGYRGEYQDKIPLNSLGVAPVLLPSVGLEMHNVNLELVLFGTAGMMANIGYYFR